MGYDSRFYIVEKSDIHDETLNKYYAQVVAMFELCKSSEVTNEIHSFMHTDCYFYEIDGNTPVVEDAYGEPLTEISVAKLIPIIMKAICKNSSYRRYKPFLQLLMSFNLAEWGDKLVVLHYGH